VLITIRSSSAPTGVRAAVVVGGLSEKSQLQAIRKGTQVLIATAGRLDDFLSRGLVDLDAATLVVLDEAGRMLDMGFLPTIKRILTSLPAAHQTLFLSATIESSVKHLVETHVPNALRIELGSTTKPVEQVDLHFYEVEHDSELELLQSMRKAPFWYSPALACIAVPVAAVGVHTLPSSGTAALNSVPVG
jgi:ATP-dependent RNA helicase RhlE